MFPRMLQEQGHKLEDDVIVAVKGRLDRRDESRFGLIAQTITVLSGLADGPAQPLRLRLPSTSLDELRIQRLKRILRDHPGDSIVQIEIGVGERDGIVRGYDERHFPSPIWQLALHCATTTRGRHKRGVPGRFVTTQSSTASCPNAMRSSPTERSMSTRNSSDSRRTFP